MKILAFVDSHTNKQAYAALREKSKQADLVLCAGDISIFGLEMMEALEEMNSWNKPVFFIHGNHEDEDMLIDVNEHYPNLHFVHKKEREFNGLAVWGYGGGGFSTTDRELESYAKQFSHRPNRIIMFHGPPHGTAVDFKNEYEGHVGCKSRRKVIEQLKPIIAIAGHIHGCFNKFEKLGNTLVINPGPSGKLITISDAKETVKKNAAKKKKEMIKAVFFDFDGTIADTFQIVLNGVNEILKEGKYPQIEDPESLRDYSAFEVLTKVKVPIWKLPFIQREVLARIANDMQGAKTFSGMPALIAQLCLQYVVGVVTSNGQDSVDTILRKSKIGLDLLHTQSSIFGKGKVIARACKEHGLDPSEVIYVGDEIRDIEAARKAGCKVISVTWGYNTERSLKASNPDAIADTPLQLASAIKKLTKN